MFSAEHMIPFFSLNLSFPVFLAWFRGECCRVLSFKDSEPLSLGSE